MNAVAKPKVHAKTPYEKWQDTVNTAKTDGRWNEYDEQIHATVAELNTRLAKLSGYRPLDEKLIKAMLWVESGGPDNTAWTLRPMQIGNPGDPGLAALLGGKEGGDLILTEAQRLSLKAGASKAGPNILAGSAYLLMRAASTTFRSVADTQDTQTFEVTVKAGDNLEKIAKANGSTVDMLKHLNPKATVMILPGQVLKVQKASIQQVITAWAAITPDFAARRYNTRDPMYRKKLEYCLQLMAEMEATQRTSPGAAAPVP